MSQVSDVGGHYETQARIEQVGVAPLPAVSVVIAAFTMRRWEYLKQAVESVRSQSIRPAEFIIVVDHNPELLARAQAEMPDLTVIPNMRTTGSSGARNTGAALSQSDIIAFLDDDIIAGAAWLETVLRHFARPEVVGVGGRATPLWQESCPAWFPPEFFWVVGVSYTGMPESVGAVRNVWSSNMAVRRAIFERAGGFRDDIAKIAGRPMPDDTDLCLRAAVAQSSGLWIYEPEALARHWVPRERAKFSYFLYRCFYEGLGKGALAALNGLRMSTSVEGRYIGHVLSAALRRDSIGALRGQVSAARRIGATALGLGVAVAGFLAGASKYYLRLGRLSSPAD